MNLKRNILLALIITIAVASILLGGKPKAPPPVDRGDMSHGQAQVGGAFTLTDQNGNAVQDKDFRRRLMLVFFGFTHCPDICPVSVANLSKMMTLLGDKANQVAPIFITVDPERDTPAVMKQYLANFDPRIVGLTGTPQQLAQAAQAYKAYYAKQEDSHDDHHEQAAHHEHGAGHEAYSVNHSGFIYLMGKDGRFIQLFEYNAEPQALADAVAKAL